jgi:hypothetical protein
MFATLRHQTQLWRHNVIKHDDDEQMIDFQIMAGKIMAFKDMLYPSVTWCTLRVATPRGDEVLCSEWQSNRIHLKSSFTSQWFFKGIGVSMYTWTHDVYT